MSERAERLHTTVDGQLAELAALLAAVDPATLRRPCPGREKLGDGTLGAVADHTAENYQRIATFVVTWGSITAAHVPPTPQAVTDPHDAPDRADTLDSARLVLRLAHARRQFAGIARLSERQLDTAPAAGSFRFCDGQRTLDQVLAGLFTHQAHQIGVIRAAVAEYRPPR